MLLPYFIPKFFHRLEKAVATHLLQLSPQLTLPFHTPPASDSQGTLATSPSGSHRTLFNQTTTYNVAEAPVLPLYNFYPYQERPLHQLWVHTMAGNLDLTNYQKGFSEREPPSSLYSFYKIAPINLIQTLQIPLTH